MISPFCSAMNSKSPGRCQPTRYLASAEPTWPPLHRVHRPPSRENPTVPRGHPGQRDGSQDRASDLFVERRAPALLVVARELEIVALARHADGDVADAGPGVEPCAKGP